MSLGAIDFGLIVDRAVIIVEAIIHSLHLNPEGELSGKAMDEKVHEASVKIRSSAAFEEIIILIVHLPILALVSIEGKMFKPIFICHFGTLHSFINLRSDGFRFVFEQNDFPQKEHF